MKNGVFIALGLIGLIVITIAILQYWEKWRSGPSPRRGNHLVFTVWRREKFAGRLSSADQPYEE